MVTASLLCAALLLFCCPRGNTPRAWRLGYYREIGPVPVEVGVASLIWMGTTSWVAQRLAGHTLPSPLALCAWVGSRETKY